MAEARLTARQGPVTMTVANWITIFRIILIPVFVAFCVYYGESVHAGAPAEWQRLAAVAAFVVASLSDALDGFIARRFNQFSRLGRILDPLADKGLMLAAVITLSFSRWHYMLPVWFVVLIISRDVIILGGFALVQHLTSHLEVQPSLLGKACTASQMIVIVLVLLQSPTAPPLIYDISVGVAALLTFLSGADYVRQGVRHIQTHGHGEAS